MAASGMGPARPSSMGPMYVAQGQRLPQHPGYHGGQQGPPRPQQGLKRPYGSEVSCLGCVTHSAQKRHSAEY